MIETGLALSTCAAATLRPLFRKLASYVFGGRTSQGDSSYSRNFRTSVRVGYVRSGSGNNNGHMEDSEEWRSYGKNIGIRSEITAHAVDGDNVIDLTSWPEESHSVGAEVDKVTNSSRTNLKTNEEYDLPAVDAISGIKKGRPVSS